MADLGRPYRMFSQPGGLWAESVKFRGAIPVMRPRERRKTRGLTPLSAVRSCKLKSCRIVHPIEEGLSGSPPQRRSGEFYEEATRGRSAFHHLPGQSCARPPLSRPRFTKSLCPVSCAKVRPPRKPSCATTPRPNSANCCANCARRIKAATLAT